LKARSRQWAQELNHKLFAWSITEGLVDTADGSAHEGQEPAGNAPEGSELPENTMVLLRDFHLFLDSPNPVLVRTLKDVLRAGKTKGKALVVLACRQVLPPEMEREFVVVEFALPGREELEQCWTTSPSRPARQSPRGRSGITCWTPRADSPQSKGKTHLRCP